MKLRLLNLISLVNKIVLMIDHLPSNVLIYCVFPYLRDAEMRALSITCKKINKIVHRYCITDKSSIKDLCQRGDLLIIYKRDLAVENPQTFKLICKEGYISLVRKSINNYRFSKKNYNFGMVEACYGGYRKIVDLMIEKGADDLHWGFYSACEGGRREIVEMMITLLFNNGLVNNGSFNNGLDDMIVDNNYIWNEGLQCACEGGNQEVIDLMIENGANNWNKGLIGACEGGHLDIINSIISIQHENKRRIDWNQGLYGACCGGHYEIAKLMIERGAYDQCDGLMEACRRGHSKIVELMISLQHNRWNDDVLTANENGVFVNVSIWDRLLERACEGGNREIIDLIIKKGAKNWGNGFVGACRGGHREIVDLMVSFSQNDSIFLDLRGGLRSACRGGHREIVDLIISLLGENGGSEDWNYGLREACYEEHHDIVKLMIEKGATNCFWCFVSMSLHYRDEFYL